MQLLGRVETRPEDRRDRIERCVVVGVAVEPSDRAREAYGRDGGFWVSGVPENPANAAYIVRILSPKDL